MTRIDLNDIRDARRRARLHGCLSVITATIGLIVMFAVSMSPVLLVIVVLVTTIAIYGAWLTLVKSAELLTEVERNIREKERDRS